MRRQYPPTNGFCLACSNRPLEPQELNFTNIIPHYCTIVDNWQVVCLLCEKRLLVGVRFAELSAKSQKDRAYFEKATRGVVLDYA